MRQFPVMHADRFGCPKTIPWDALDEVWAMRVHGQTLERLAARGGLDPVEIAMNIERITWNSSRCYGISEAQCVQMIKNMVAEIPK